MRAATEAYVTGYSESERQQLVLPAQIRAESLLLGAPSWIRACAGAICGRSASWLWFLEWLGIAWNIYGLVGSLVMAALFLRSRVSRMVASATE